MQPQGFDEFVGQQHLLSHNKPLRRLIEEDKIVSVIFYGPPGTGKTALAHIIARRTNARFIAINAVTAGIKDIREAVESSRGDRAILFVDEIHRFNKTQQDALLPHVEKEKLSLSAHRRRTRISLLFRHCPPAHSYFRSDRFPQRN